VRSSAAVGFESGGGPDDAVQSGGGPDDAVWSGAQPDGLSALAGLAGTALVRSDPETSDAFTEALLNDRDAPMMPVL